MCHCLPVVRNVGHVAAKVRPTQHHTHCPARGCAASRGTGVDVNATQLQKVSQLFTSRGVNQKLLYRMSVYICIRGTFGNAANIKIELVVEANTVVFYLCLKRIPLTMKMLHNF